MVDMKDSMRSTPGEKYAEPAKTRHSATEIITGEAVALELPPATVFSRLISGAIDLVCFAVPMLYLDYVISNIPFSRATEVSAYIINTLIWICVVPALIGIVTKGFSPGKRLLGYRIVSGDAGAVTIRQNILRSLVGISEIWLMAGVPAFISLACTRRARRMGDLLSGTYAVKWPKGTLKIPAFDVPGALEPWAAAAQTRPLAEPLQLHILNHFRTRSSLAPHIRRSQALILAATAEKFVSPAPPPGTPAEDFLQALLALRRKTETEKNEKSEIRRRRLEKRLSVLPYVRQ